MMDFLEFIESLSRIFSTYLCGNIIALALIFFIGYLFFLVMEKHSKKKKLKKLLKGKDTNSVIRNYCNSCNRETFWYISVESGEIKKFYCLSCNDNLK